MRFEEPKIEFIQFDREVVTGSNTCKDGYTGGTLVCTGAWMDDWCGAKMVATG